MTTYIVSWKFAPASFKAIVARFLETGGAVPEGVTLLGRWHGMNGQGIEIVKAEDPKAIFRLQAEWMDLMEMSVTPCMTDEEAGPILATL